MILFDSVFGGMRHATSVDGGVVGKDGKTFSYIRGVAYSSFQDLPGCANAPESTCGGEACYIGYGNWTLTWNDDGTRKNTFTGFTPALGVNPPQLTRGKISL